jgi:hypothetical protein
MGVAAWISAWRSLGPKMPGHDLVAERGNLEKGLFGLWAIRHSTKDSAKVISTAYLGVFLWEAFELKTHGRSLQKAFNSETARGKVEKVGGTRYQILPPGVQFIENLVRAVPEGGTASSTAPATRRRKPSSPARK